MKNKRVVLNPPSHVKTSFSDEDYRKARKRIKSKCELKVLYGGEGVNTELDKALEKCIEKLGYKRQASSADLTINVNELKIFYGGEGIHNKLDKAFEECLAKFNYHRWASGIDLTTDVRELAFEKIT